MRALLMGYPVPRTRQIYLIYRAQGLILTCLEFIMRSFYLFLILFWAGLPAVCNAQEGAREQAIEELFDEFLNNQGLRLY